MRVRFDDSLKTVLAADASTAFGAQAAYRQLVDLVARGRVPADDVIVARLEELTNQVPTEVRAAAARGLALASPPAALVGLLATDEPAVARAILRIARLDEAAWIDLLPRIGPTGRAVLRARGDLGAAVERALQSFGSVDFSLGFAGQSETAPAAPPQPEPIVVTIPAAAPTETTGDFVALGRVADAIPIVAEARRRMRDEPAEPSPPRYEIAELMHRIAAYQRDRPPVASLPDEGEHPATVDGFAFDTDASGVIRYVDVAPRSAVIGLSLAADQGASVDGVASGAFRRRTGFRDARLSIGGRSPLAGDWRISAVPLFDQASGRFTGYRGNARRPRTDESAAPIGNAAGAESLRRLVHELRTPTNAIAGFSELIEGQLLGAVPPAYRERAATIRGHANDLVAAIEDLDTAARIEGGALELRTGLTALEPLLVRIVTDLVPLAELRGCTLELTALPSGLALASDDRASERLLARLLTALVSAGRPGEHLALSCALEPGDLVGIAITRPSTLANVSETALFSLDAEREADLPGAPLLGTGFALRLARNLAAELGGSLVIDAARLTLRLPTGSIDTMGQASTN